MKWKAVQAPDAPKPLGNYSHAAIVGDLVFVCGIGPRDPVTNQVPGLRLDEQGVRLSYDVKAEMRMCLDNLKAILRASGSDIDGVVEVNVFLTDMADFDAMNEVYAETFRGPQFPVRTTVAVRSLPGPIAVEIKAVAVRKG